MVPALKQGDERLAIIVSLTVVRRGVIFCNPVNYVVHNDLYLELTFFERLELVDTMEQTKRIAS